jgi:aminoglycoside phosphotransferase (APT) family kinase protein
VSAETALVDEAVLAAWLADQGIGDGRIDDVELLAGGTQNVLVRFRCGADRYVLRRPPVHKRRGSDETIRREATLLAALVGTIVPHPRLVAACGDPEVLGAAFYVMDEVEGCNITVQMSPAHAGSAAIRREMGLRMADAAAALGMLDPVAHGLAGFGRPEGYLERQVGRWWSQLESYHDTPGYSTDELTGVADVAAWLGSQRPAQGRPGIVHGDYHMGNVLFRPDGPELSAIVDWELCTLGDPLVDLGELLATWPDPDDDRPLFDVEPSDGFVSRQELVRRYAENSARDVSAATWFEVLVCYRLAIIIEGTYARSLVGLAPRDVGAQLHANALHFLARARRLIA